MTIRILPPQLANQIAAGEVVERPASIIKELVENSIDSGANRIDIDIEQGGCKLIRIRDNGCGIAKDDLPLALARHATSKISSLDDLEAIVSLGFRGEALASISSVSRLTLTSKPDEQAEAWQVYAEGRDMAAVIKPASHPTGTTVEVLDIFYNTPARRRFLKTEKTEFTHIDEVVRRIALVCPHIAFNLQHNGKLLRQYRAADSEAQVEKRLVAVCGMAFMQKAIKLCWEHDYLSIKGWVATNIGQESIQYFYVNGRVVKDRLLNHALKQAFHELSASSVYSTDETLSYVIYLELDPHHVDVNVHPAKHEVRFHEARLVHDFVHQAMFMALEEQKKPSLALDKNSQQNDNQPIQPQPVNQNRTAAGQNIFNTPAAPTSTPSNNTNTHQYSDYGVKKASHIKENRLYGQLVESQTENHHVKEDYISPEQQAVIESLFPKRTQPFQAVHKEVDLSSAMNLGKVLTIIDNQYVLLEKYQYNHQQISLLSLKKAQQAFFMATMATDDELLSTEHLLIPLSMLLSKAEQQLIEQTQSVLTQLSFQFCIERSKLQLNAVPKLMRKANWQQLFPKLIAFMQSHCSSSELKSLLTNWLAEQYMQIDHNQEIAWNVTQVIQFLTKFEQLQEVPCNMNEIVKPVELSSIISLFK